MKIQLINISPPVDIEAYIGLLTHLALILDQEDFLDHVSELRDNWELTDQLVEAENLAKWLTGYHPTFKLTPWAVDVLDSASQKISTDSSSNDISSSQFEHKTIEAVYRLDQKTKEYAYSNPIDVEIDILLKRFIIPEEFRDLITKSVVCGIVSEKDYLDNSDKLPHSELGDWFYEDINLDTRITGYIFDTKNELLRDREWHKLKREGLSYTQIAKQDPKRGEINLDTYTKRVKDQVKRYRAFLNKGASFRK